ncbi:uncharacterized protein LOC126678139 [Mercurialis annua]|uniref:uncharacterized protein LOC126678139 n=1 Tax=Mercurialis annua TaxID=3986 RepID=UPI0021606F00|nr:uncharacterized protein LOC126678139 [Mercurialis annua]XP_050228984.1 uncharacterized protein LOC126678139 [Mercurialis annua]
MPVYFPSRSSINPCNTDRKGDDESSSQTFVSEQQVYLKGKRESANERLDMSNSKSLWLWNFVRFPAEKPDFDSAVIDGSFHGAGRIQSCSAYIHVKRKQQAGCLQYTPFGLTKKLKPSCIIERYRKKVNIGLTQRTKSKKLDKRKSEVDEELITWFFYTFTVLSLA